MEEEKKRFLTPNMASYGTQQSSERRTLVSPRRDIPGRQITHPAVARSVDQAIERHNAIFPRSDSSSVIRRPYLPIPRSRNTSVSTDVPSTITEAYRNDENMAIRYRLYNRLAPNNRALLMPDHVYPSTLFSILPFDEFKDNEGKQGSLVSIFSIFSTMLGTSLLAMPWAIQQAGLALGVGLVLFMGALSLYTAYRVVDSPRGLTLDVDSNVAEFSDVCRYYFGKKGEYFALVCSIIVLMGGCIVYFILMSQFLYSTVNIVYESLQPNSTTLPVLANRTFTCDIYYDKSCIPPTFNEAPHYEPVISPQDDGFWTYQNLWQLRGSVPFVLAITTFPVMNLKSPTFFTKFNVLGTVSVVYLIGFVISKAFECGFNVNFVDPTSLNYVKLWSWSAPALSGTLALSFFIHNAVLTILRNQKKPENNTRDLTVGYALATTCYMLIGVLFFLAFPGRRECIADNFLNNFGSGDVLSALARVFLLFQMLTVLPLIIYIIRVQFCYAIIGANTYSFKLVCLINLAIYTVAVFFCVCFPTIGAILRYVGSCCGAIYVFTLPCLVYMFRLRAEGRLTPLQMTIHGSIILLGVVNLISQFVI